MSAKPPIQRAHVYGATVLTLQDNSFPLVRFVIATRRGSVADALGKSGTARIMLELLLRGTERADRRAFNEELDALGSGLDTAAGAEMGVLRGVCLTRHTERTWALACEALLRPAFAESELQALCEEAIDALHGDRDDDDSIAELFLRRHLYAGHPLARSPAGEVDELSALGVDDVRAAHSSWDTQGTVVAFAGDIDSAMAERLASPLLAELARRRGPALLDVPAAQQPRGRRIVVVDKPERTQVQLRVARMGLDGRHPDVEPFWLGIVAFGGTFTSPLTRQVRDERGWSYVAHADFRRRGLFASPLVLRSAPALDDALPCLDLELGLYDGLARGELEVAAVAQARQYLQNRYPFEVATAFDRLGAAVGTQMLEQPLSHLSDFPRRLAALEPASIPGVVARHLQGDDVLALLVAPKEAVLEPLQARYGVDRVSVVDFREGLGLKPGL